MNISFATAPSFTQDAFGEGICISMKGAKS
jgi:hypothetical protein